MLSENNTKVRELVNLLCQLMAQEANSDPESLDLMVFPETRTTSKVVFGNNDFRAEIYINNRAMGSAHENPYLD